MKFLTVNHNNISELNEFIKTMGDSSQKFRYYSTREPNKVIDNHIITLLLCDSEIIGYGHLDNDGTKVWLGICIKEGYCGRGYGKKMMNQLISHYKGDIYLSVDKDNKAAISLYNLFQFKSIKQDDKALYMKRGCL